MPDEEFVPAPPLEGRFVRLRPVLPTDYEYLYRLATMPEVAHRWRTQGSTPSPGAFPDTVWRDVLVQFIAEKRDTSEPIGLVSCFAANHREGFAHVAIVSDPRLARGGLVMTSMTLLLNYIFTLWNFRKLYMEVPAFNYVNIQSGEGRYFHEEGRLQGHLFYGNRYWDLYILALYREDWERVRDASLSLAL